MRYFFLFIATIVFAQASASEVTIRLKEAVTVASDSVTMGALASFEGDAALIAKLEPMVVRRLDGIGTWKVDGRLINGLTRAFRPAHKFTINGTTLVTRKAKVFTAEELALEARTYLLTNREGREVQAEVLRAARVLTVPAYADDRTKIVVERMTADWWGEVPIRIKVMRGERELARTLIIFKIEAYKRVVVAERNLPPGHTINLNDCRLERVLVSNRVGKSPTDIATVVGWVTRRHHNPGDPITPVTATPPPDVHAGHTVVLIYENETFRLATHATALADGTKGETVRARTQAGTIVETQVVGTNELRVVTP